MNILFLSSLSGNLWAGPNNSVPAQVLAQAKIDNVMWVNLNNNCLSGWRREEYVFANYDDYPNCRLSDLPHPFDKPDFIVCEAIYDYPPFNKMLRSVVASGIPYSIVPRSNLTVMAQKFKPLKKKLGNLLFYSWFIKHSIAIQYLTKYEEDESKKLFAHPSFVIPNGTNLPQVSTKDFCHEGISAVYIGRIDIYQKGLDLLFDVINEIKDVLRKENFFLNLYGPDRYDSIPILEEKISLFQLSDLIKINNSVFAEEKSTILQNTDVFIMTSRFEGLPMGLIEALGYGVPCLVTEGTYLMDEIAKYDAGWAAGSTKDTILNAFNQMIEDRIVFNHKSENARSLASHYSWDSLAEQLHNTIAKITSR